MGNINNQTYKTLDFQLSNNGYWDMYLAADTLNGSGFNPILTGDCFVVWYDFANPETFGTGDTQDTIYSLVSWTGATNSGYTLNTVGLTGLDNGLVKFEKNNLDPTNQNLISALTGSTLIIPSGDTRLTLNAISGFTGNFLYPINFVETTGVTGNYMQLCGGFYQGFYKIDGTDYQVLPNRVNQAWVAEFWLKPTDYCLGCTYQQFQDGECFEFMDGVGYDFMSNITGSTLSAMTLNESYPNNKGFFFYIGARAENKYWNQFYGNNTGCTSACTISDTACTETVTSFCTIPKESDISLIGDYGFAIPLIPPQVEIELVTNTFLIYGRARDVSNERLTGDTGTILMSAITNTSDTDDCCRFNIGSSDGLGTKTVHTYDGKGIAVAKTKQMPSSDVNPFLIYGRSAGYNSGCTCGCCTTDDNGYGTQTTCSFNRYTPVTQLDYNLDIIDNALGFRIKPDGSIGYRLLTMTGACITSSGETIYQSGVTIQEEYSISGVVQTDKWSYVVVKFVTNYDEVCDNSLPRQRIGKLMFYVDSKLKFVVDDFPEFIAKRLDENRLKQVGVPFNLSLGGGSLGLLENQTFDGPDGDDLGLPIEENFAGTFIGQISQFKFNICDLTYAQIKHNYLLDKDRYI